MDKVIKNKRGLTLVTSHSSGYKSSSQKIVYYILSDQVWLYNIKRFFGLFQKLHKQIYACQFMTSWIIPLPFVLLNLESLEREVKLQQFNYLENEKSILKWNKKHFHNFGRAIVWWKNKNLIKNSGRFNCSERSRFIYHGLMIKGSCIPGHIISNFWLNIRKMRYTKGTQLIFF